MRRFNFTVALAVSLLFMGGCAEQGSEQDEPDDSAYIETFPASGLRKSADSLQVLAPADPTPAHHDFAFANYRANTPFDENTVSAPFDLQLLLSNVALGAEGTTLEAFNTASGFDLNDDSVYAGISIWEQQIAALNGIERRGFLWGQREYGFAPSYLQTQAELFGPAMSGLDFLGDQSSSQTHIEDTLGGQPVVSNINSRTRLVAAQTTRLETGWAVTSSIESVSGRFGPHEEQRWVDMVRVTGMHSTAVGDNYQAVEVPLANPNLSIVMIIPARRKFDNIRQNLDTTLWADIRDQLDATAPTAESTVYIPRFALTREVTSDNMPDLSTALSDTAANFSRINNAGFLYLEVPRQHLSLSIDEQGLSSTTITAATYTATDDEPTNLFNLGTGGGGSAGFMVTTPPSTQPCFYPPEQSPFLFAIYATASDTLLHLGQVRALDGLPVDADWTVPWVITRSCGTTPPIEIYKYSGAKQCEAGSGIPIWDMGQELSNAGIEILESNQSNDGRLYITLCGSADGTINVFTIPESQVPLSETLGFNRLSELTP